MNLKDVLIRSRLDPFDNPGLSGKLVKDDDFCRFKNCNICKELKSKTFKSEVTNKIYKTPKNSICVTENVVYLLTCTNCLKQYVGETKRGFVVRLKEHLADIRLKRDKPVANHIKSHDCPLTTIKFCIIEVLPHDPILPETTILRKKREIFWIYRLRTLIPHGLNSLG